MKVVKVLGVLLVLGAIGAFYNARENAEHAAGVARPAAGPVAGKAPEGAAEALQSSPSADAAPGWVEDRQADPMTGKETITKRVTSDSSLRLDFPYHGRNYGALHVRRSPQYGTDVYVTIERGQLVCGFDGCTVQVRFDDGKAVTYRANGPTDHSSTALFLSPANAFIRAAKTARRIRVQMTVYEAGEQVLEFTTPAGLQWPPK